MLLGCLGGLEAALGRVDAPQAAGPEILGALESVLDPSWVPKESQDGTQNDQKSIIKSFQKMIAF